MFTDDSINVTGAFHKSQFDYTPMPLTYQD